MRLDEQVLREIIAGNPVGQAWPFDGGTADDVEEYLRGIMNRLRRKDLLEVLGEFGAYGSGYASYVHLFCQRSDGKSSSTRDEVTTTEGLTVYLSRLAPVAVMGPETRTTFERGSSHGFLEAALVGEMPDASWRPEVEWIVKVLEGEGIELLGRDAVEKKLDFEVEINTNFNDQTVFDALFYWWD